MPGETGRPLEGGLPGEITGRPLGGERRKKIEEIVEELQTKIDNQEEEIKELKKGIEEKFEGIEELDRLLKNHKHEGLETPNLRFSIIYSNGIKIIDTTGPGTVATNGTTTLTGTDTEFLTTFEVGDIIKVANEGTKTIATITNDTSLTISATFSTTASGLSYGLVDPPSDVPSKKLEEQILIYKVADLQQLYIYVSEDLVWRYVNLT